MSGPKLRAALDSIPAYVPGKPPTLPEGMTAYKLSSNENPYPPLPGVLDRAGAALTAVNRYPDMGVSSLYAALSAKLGLPEEQLATGTGSVAVLYHLLQALCEEGDDVVYAWRSFEAYPCSQRDSPVDLRRLPRSARDAYGHHAHHQSGHRLYAEQSNRPSRQG